MAYMHMMFAIGESQLQRFKPPKSHIFRDKTNPLDVLDDKEVITRYHLPRQYIIDLRDDFDRPTKTSYSLPTSTHSQFVLAVDHTS